MVVDVLSSFAIISLRKRELRLLCFTCALAVMWHSVFSVSLNDGANTVIVAFPCHTHLPFLLLLVFSVCEASLQLSNIWLQCSPFKMLCFEPIP